MTAGGGNKGSLSLTQCYCDILLSPTQQCDSDMCLGPTCHCLVHWFKILLRTFGVLTWHVNMMLLHKEEHKSTQPIFL